MDYFKNYHDCALYIKSLNREKGPGNYYEKHHIIPRCLGGDNNPDNLILLTAREHFLAHYLLCKMYEKNPIEHEKLLRAFMAMTWGKTVRYFNSRLFEKLKKKDSEYRRQRMLGAHIQPAGYTHSEETKQKLKDARKGRKPSLGMHHSEETKKVLRDQHSSDVLMWNDIEGKGAWVPETEIDVFLLRGFRLGGHPNSPLAVQKFKEFAKRPRSEEHKIAISSALKGKKKTREAIEASRKSRLKNAKPVSEETKKKLSENHKNRVWIHKETNCKMCKRVELDIYLNQGWLVGRKR